MLKFTKLIFKETNKKKRKKTQTYGSTDDWGLSYSLKKNKNHINLLAYINMHTQINKPIKYPFTYWMYNDQLSLSNSLVNQCNSLVNDLEVTSTETYSYHSKNPQTLTKRLNAGFKKIFQSCPFGQVPQWHHCDLGKIWKAVTMTDLLQLKCWFRSSAASLGRLPRRKHSSEVSTRWVSGKFYAAWKRGTDLKGN